MKNALFFALVAVSALTCVVPASFKIVSANQNFAICSNARCSRNIIRPENKSEVLLSSKQTNQPTAPKKKQSTPTSGKDRGQPKDSVPAGRRLVANV